MNNFIQPISSSLVIEMFWQQKLATKQNCLQLPQKMAATFYITTCRSRGSLRRIIAWKMEAIWQRFTTYRTPMLW